MLLSAAIGVGCATTEPAVLDPAQLAEAVANLTRPLPGDLAALYRMRVARSGGLRLAVLAADRDVRMTVSEPFGAAVSLTSWTAPGPAVSFDMERGCRRDSDELRAVLGVDALPLGQAARLLAGRLPALDGDTVVVNDAGLVEVRGDNWDSTVTRRELS